MEARSIKVEDAYDMAAKVWGGQRVMSIAQHNWGFRVNLTLLHGDGRQRASASHKLDIEGHVTCHDDCKLLDCTRTIIPIRGNKNGVRL